MNYGIAVHTALPFAAAAARVRDALREQGFGVLTENDIQVTMREKLGQQMDQYLILGACNPPLAHRALATDISVGLLLPCNVVIRAGAGQTVVEALDPQMMVTVTGEPALKPVAEEAASRLRAALAALPAA
jgi:uncharacterized protein (DUF302 family)